MPISNFLRELLIDPVVCTYEHFAAGLRLSKIELLMTEVNQKVGNFIARSHDLRDVSIDNPL